MALGIDVFDEDAGVVFTERLPLDRLIEAAQSTRLRIPPTASYRVDPSRRYTACFPKSEWAKRTPYWYR